MELETRDSDDNRGVMRHLIPSRASTDSISYLEVDMPVLTFWQKMEVYLKIISVPLIIVAVAVVGFLLRFFREIIIPTILALFLFQLSKPMVLRLHRPIIPYFVLEEQDLSDEEKQLIEANENKQKKHFVLKWGTPYRPICSLITVTLLVGIILLFIYPIALSIQNFMREDYKLYVTHAYELINSTAEWFNETLKIDINDEIERIAKSSVLEKISKLLTASLVCIGFTILIYMFLLFGSSMRKFDSSSLRYKAENQITSYLIIKTVLSFILGITVWIVFGPILHIPMAVIFALLFFALNFIPHIGPIIAVCIPIPLILFDPRFNMIQIAFAIIFPTLMNLLLQDFIEPKVLGDSLHLHPIVVIVCLVVWALLWGPIGAVLAVPLTACVKIVIHNIKHPYAKIVDAWLGGDFCCVHINDKEAGELSPTIIV